MLGGDDPRGEPNQHRAKTDDRHTSSEDGLHHHPPAKDSSGGRNDDDDDDDDDDNVGALGEESEADEQSSLMPDVVNRHARRSADVSSSSAHRVWDHVPYPVRSVLAFLHASLVGPVDQRRRWRHHRPLAFTPTALL